MWGASSQFISTKMVIFAPRNSQLNKLNETIKDHKVHYQPRKRFVDKYLQEIGREDLITVEEEVELAQAIKRGDRRALEKLTRAESPSRRFCG